MSGFVFGTWQCAPSDGFWCNQDPLESERLLGQAVRMGIRSFDTAQSYGKGRAEQLLGKVLSRFPNEGFRVDTKIMPTTKDPLDLVRLSLSRLRVQRLNRLYLHWPRTGFNAAMFIEGIAKCKDIGLVEKVGICNAPLDYLGNLCRELAERSVALDCLQVPVSLLWTRDLDDTLAFCHDHGIEVVAYSPMGMGLLSGKYEKADSLDDELKELARTSRDKYEQQMDKLQLHLALEEVFKLIQRANKYIDETAPWQLAKDESKKARLASVLYNLLECLRISLIMLKPFIPESCEKAFAQIGADEKSSSWDSAAVFGALPANVSVHKGETLFPRLDMEKALAELEKMNAPAKPQFDPIEPDVSIEDFSRCDMRVCKVLSCEAVKKSKKLLKFMLDDGTGTPRQILSGIHEFYEPEQLVGKTVVAILNLPKRKMMGQDSCGMLISAAHEHDGKEQLHLLMLDDSIPAGFRLC